MPDSVQTPDNTGALISSASSIASQAIGAFAQASLNKRTRDYNTQMYKQQRIDALSDWNKQNEYNSPAAQMARFKAAGLNPNLIYGRGDSGNATTVRSSSPGQWNPKAPDLSGIPMALGSYFNIQNQQAQLMNMMAQNKVLQAQKENIDADTQVKLSTKPKIDVETDQAKFNLQLAAELRPVSVALREGDLSKLNAEIAKTNAETTFRLDENARQTASNAVSIEEGVTRILKNMAETENIQTEKIKLQQEIELLAQSGILKQLDIDFIKATGNTGRPHDSALPKMIELFMGKLFQSKNKNAPQGDLQLGNTEDSLEEYFRNKNQNEMKSADWRQYTR